MAISYLSNLYSSISLSEASGRFHTGSSTIDDALSVLDDNLDHRDTEILNPIRKGNIEIKTIVDEKEISSGARTRRTADKKVIIEIYLFAKNIEGLILFELINARNLPQVAQLSKQAQAGTVTEEEYVKKIAELEHQKLVQMGEFFTKYPRLNLSGYEQYTQRGPYSSFETYFQKIQGSGYLERIKERFARLTKGTFFKGSPRILPWKSNISGLSFQGRPFCL